MPTAIPSSDTPSPTLTHTPEPSLTPTEESTPTDEASENQGKDDLGVEEEDGLVLEETADVLETPEARPIPVQEMLDQGNYYRDTIQDPDSNHLLLLIDL